MPRASQSRAYLAVFASVVLWGSYPATAKMVLGDFPPIFLVTVRCTIASGFLVLMLVRSGVDLAPALTPTAIRSFLVLAVTGIAGSTHLSYLSYYYTTAANAAILQAAAPVMVAVGAWLYLGERLRPPQWVGVGVSAFGVLVVVTSGRLAALRLEELRPGDFIALASLACWSAYTIYGKRVLATYSPALATTAAYVLGTTILLPIALVTAPLFPAPRVGSAAAWTVVLYHALPGAVAHVWWYRAVKLVGAGRTAVFMNLQPIVGIVLAALLLHERIGLAQVGGVALVLAGVTLTTRGRPG